MTAAQSNRKLGIMFAILATIIFAAGDAVSKTLVVDHSVWFIMMARYWFHLVVALVWATSSKKGLVGSFRSGNPLVQLIRSVLLFTEIALIIITFGMLGLAETTTLIMVHPLMVTALAAMFLGESVGWRRLVALLVGMAGLVIIMQPTGNIWGTGGLIGLAATSSFAVYQLFTRMASRYDDALTSFLYAGVIGVVMSTVMGIPNIPPWGEINWLLLALACFGSTFAHFCVIKALSLTFASEIQPFTYLQIVWSIPIGFLVFGTLPIWTTILGAALIVAAGLYSIHRSNQMAKDAETA
ncbi:DMT family transporter [Cohaesibacter celericrescens]|uniref:EamA/RhaT family transporter n=1 Tax=Cohaesibacter celericrescens TaxID=2067669 RepID=A0A2N5XTZ8_9HYPH|nr:DMT family transporter [Cohaesibacter celericrescens]PLW77991.1 EamA/RhaT family transporter [Cohaesibacter celericrescens]